MFRNPRENASLPPDRHIKPSVGRPPSPPLTTSKSHAQETHTAVPPVMASKTPQSKGGRTKPSSSASKPRQTKLSFNGAAKGSGPAGGGKNAAKKSAQKPNGKIMDFFKKMEEKEQMLFVESRKGSFVPTAEDEEEEESENDLSDAEMTEPQDKFNEVEGSVKRRRIDQDAPAATACTPPPPDLADQTNEGSNDRRPSVNKPSKHVGPFIEDSDSEDEETAAAAKIRERRAWQSKSFSEEDSAPVPDPADTGHEDGDPENATVKEPSPLKHDELTSYNDDSVFEVFENIEDFDDEEFNDGEENIERRYIEEQRRLEIEAGTFEGDDVFDDFDTTSTFADSGVELQSTAEEASCPICNISLSGISDQTASVHVNNCLDGNPTPLPERNPPPDKPTPKRIENGRQFQRPERPARPGQASPFTLGDAAGTKASAFSKLMSGHAEDAAWATAAKAETEARGKPSFQRTCPFYKILPGFYICVDAFRYGAVKDCRAYFLSHFHSDHYIGLTAKWCHGPIYCSRVTANLVRQQLRVDSKWVIGLEFEEKIEVPNTKGVYVTMIPANHCPGSSLFLFEKTIGSGKNPKTQRVLHCGDFRACRAHVEHPLLRPDVLNDIGEKVGQQRIDVCYLDTTYLNPKYAFPNQEDVITACADMCVSLNKEQVDEKDSWETMKRERAGEGMAKFVQKGSEAIKQEKPEGDDDAMTIQRTAHSRGRLLVVVGTYSIGKERMCLGIARALDSKIYAPPGKMKICACLEDPELNARLTADPREAQVHMTPLFEIRADTLDDYLKDYRGQFTRAVGFRPSGWNYRPPNSRFVESPAVQTVLHSPSWKTAYMMKDLHPQRGSTKRASCFGVPYSEHSSFRELTMFCCALRIDKVIPTVNVGSAKSREKMKSWIDKWAVERKKNGLYRLEKDVRW